MHLHSAKGKVKGKVPPGCLFGRAGHLCDHIFHAPGAKLWHHAAELRTLLITYPLCGLALTNTTDDPSEMCPLKLFSIDHTQSYKGSLFPQWLSQVV